MKELNKCALCGRFKPWDELGSASGDTDDCGNYEEWFECTGCMSQSALEDFKEK